MLQLQFGLSGEAIYQTGATPVWNFDLTQTGSATTSSSTTHLWLNGPANFYIGTPVIASSTVTASSFAGTNVTSGADPGHTHTAYQPTGNYVDYTGTPVNNQVAVFTDVNTVEGDANFLWDASTLEIRTGKQIMWRPADNSYDFNI